MKRLWLLLVLFGVFGERSGAAVSDLELRGDIDGENIVFELSFDMGDSDRVSLVDGDVAYLDGDIPKGMKLERSGGAYYLQRVKRSWGGGKQVRVRFACRAVKRGEWRSARFKVPAAGVRRVVVGCDRDDLDVRFPDALNVTRSRGKAGRMEVSANLGISEWVEVRWKPQVRRLESELVVSCEANSVVTAGIGALRLDSMFVYRVIQGELTRLVFDLPDMSVMRVSGTGIRSWRIDRSDASQAHLVVELSRAVAGEYRLRVEGEVVLAKFPVQSELPVLAPRGVIRTSGFLMLGTDSAIKLKVSKAVGVTQIDPSGFPTGKVGKLPSREVLAYQFANLPYKLVVDADDIVSAVNVDDRFVLRLRDDVLSFDAVMEVDIKDAPARDIRIELDCGSEWTVTGVSGRHVVDSDMDVRDESGRRVIYVPFSQAVSGVVLVKVQLERPFERDSKVFEMPHLCVLGAKSERGYLVLAAEKGIRLRAGRLEGVREVYTASAGMQVAGAQQAFRFKSGVWGLAINIERSKSVLDSEVFHLVSLGEGVMYCSAAITYHISGAPVQEFLVRVPKSIERVEFAGANIEGWQREGETCRVRLQSKILGDYTLLATYDKQFVYGDAVVEVGGIETIGSESEMGFIAVASASSLALEEEGELPSSIIRIERDELPVAYAAPVNAPIIKAYKYIKKPHLVRERIQPLETVSLLGQIADYVKLDTRLSRKGGAVTTVTYYIKNASRQYLIARLPEGVDLWTTKYVYEDGRKEDVSSQEQDDGRQILIPVKRPRNPNTAIAVEVVYAHRFGEISFWESGVRGIELEAPQLPETHATFARWEVRAPQGLVLSEPGGNMSYEGCDGVGRVEGVLKKFKRIFKAMVVDGYTLRRALSGGIGDGEVVEFTHTVDLAGGHPLRVRVAVVPEWMGANSSVRLMLGGFILGVVFLLMALFWKRRLFLSAGISGCIFGLAQSAAGRSMLAVLMWVVVLMLVLRYGRKPVWMLIRGVLWLLQGSLGWVRKTVRRRRDEDRDELVPFEDCSRGGFVKLGALVWLSLVSIGVCIMFAGENAVQDVERHKESGVAPIMDSVELDVRGPASDRDVERSAFVKMVLDFSGKEGDRFIVLPRGSVLSDVQLKGRYAVLDVDRRGYFLKVLRSGRQRVELHFLQKVQEKDGEFEVCVPLLANLSNRLKLRLPEAGMEIRAAESVIFRNVELAGGSAAEVVFGKAHQARLTWRPRVRKVRLEESVFFSEISSSASLLAGVVDIKHIVHCRISRGELKELRLQIPKGMNITAVKAVGIATWSFSPDSHLLEVILKKSVSGDFELRVQAQIANEGLPYTTEIGAPKVLGCARQRGVLAIAAPGMVQVRAESLEGVSPMNVEDFSGGGVGKRKGGGYISVRRAFRYDNPDGVLVKFGAEKVLPEIRVEEQSALSIGDERTVLSSRLRLVLAKAGVFSVNLSVPEGYEIESLSGRDVSHWDEHDGGVSVYFSRYISDATEINLVEARSEKGVEVDLEVPRVKVDGVRKQSGRLSVAGERGIRMMVESQNGVAVVKNSDISGGNTRVLLFNLLRPEWGVKLRLEVLEPLVKPEVLQVVGVNEGMLKCKVFVNYRIENAGVKSFLLKSPRAGVALAVTGRDIAGVHEIDREKGIWQVDLRRKVENHYHLSIGYQLAFDNGGGQVDVLPLRTVGTMEQRGYLVIGSGSRVQVVPGKRPGGLKIDDARNVPGGFRAGDSLANAILCYRVLRADYVLPLSVVRHEAAEVLPATVSRVRLTSVLSGNRKLLTRLEIDLSTGGLRFLRMKLPHETDKLWTVLVDGREVVSSRDGEYCCIPLDEQDRNSEAAVEIIYAGNIDGSRFLRTYQIDAPSFDGLPLNDIKWSIFVLPGVKYYGFGGSLEKVPSGNAAGVFNAEGYLEWNRQQREVTAMKAKQVLRVGKKMAHEGRQKEAKMAFQKALNYSQGKADLNEDARVQLRNVTKQQFKLGLVNRRRAVRYRNNIVDDKVGGQSVQVSQFTQDDISQLEQQLSVSDNAALDIVADKMIDQQAAAAGVVKAIRIAMPEHGRELKFAREMQVDPDGRLSISFRGDRGMLSGVAVGMVALMFVFGGVWLCLPRMQKVAA